MTLPTAREARETGTTETLEIRCETSQRQTCERWPSTTARRRAGVRLEAFLSPLGCCNLARSSMFTPFHGSRIQLQVTLTNRQYYGLLQPQFDEEIHAWNCAWDSLRARMDCKSRRVMAPSLL